MVIACIGWGSLIWNPGTLPIQGHWFEDGPYLPVEFARQSKDGRITLVICETEVQVRTLWATMKCATLEDARDALRDREKVPPKYINRHIGVWPKVREAEYQILDSIEAWAQEKQLEGVVWAALPAKYNNEIRKPTIEEVIQSLRSLTEPKLNLAKEYITRAPKQIDTPYRRQIKAELGWEPADK